MPGGPGAPHAQRYSENSEYYEGNSKNVVKYVGKKKKGNPKAIHKKRKKGY